MIHPFHEDYTVVGGLDLSSKTDLTAFAMVQRNPEKGFNVQWRFWMPKDRAVKAEKSDQVPYTRWIDDGYVIATEGNRVDYDLVHETILNDCKEHSIATIAFDPWNAEYTSQHLDREGIDTVQVRQTYGDLSEACKMLEAAVVSHTLRHYGNPVAQAHANAVSVKTDEAGNIRPVKPKHQSKQRVDGIVAAVTAIAALIVTEDDGGGYEAGSLWL